MKWKMAAVATGALLGMIGCLGPANAAHQKPRYGGILHYMVAADAPPSFDGHAEGTFATLHPFAPFYSVLIRVNPKTPSNTGDIVCDLCTHMPKPTDHGKTWTFTIRKGVKFTDGTPLTAADVAASWNESIFPPKGVVSVRQKNYIMVKSVAAPNPTTVVFHLKFATSAFLPALADPFAWIYEKKILDKDPHWYDRHVMGSGPFKFAGYQVGQSVKGVRNPDYYHKGLPYLDGFVATFAPKEVVRVDAIRAGRAAIDFRSLSPASAQELKAALDGKIAVQRHDWVCGNLLYFNENKKPFNDARVRRALTLAINRWKGAPALSKIAVVNPTVGGIVYPGSPWAMSKTKLEKIAGFWPNIKKSRAEARKLLKEAGVPHLSFTFINRNVDQPYKYVGTWLVDEWSKIGVHATQRPVPTGPWIASGRSGSYEVYMGAALCRSIPNPPIDVQVVLPHSFNAGNVGYYEDPHAIALYEQMLHETNPQKQHQLLDAFQKYMIGTKAHEIPVVWWYRTVPYRTYLHGWKISPSEYINQDLSHIWFSPPHCGKCSLTPPKTADASPK